MKKVISLVVGILICIIFFLLVDIALRFAFCLKTGSRLYLPSSFNIKFKPDDKEKIKQTRFLLRAKLVSFDRYYKLAPGKYELGAFDDSNFAYTINSSGFRSAEFLPEKSSNITRICILGGSFAFGHGVRDDETYSYYLQKILNSGGREEFEVINCAFPAYQIKEIYHLFTKEIIHYQPDIIIISSAFNDAFNPALQKEDLVIKIHRMFYNRWMLYTYLIEKYSYMKYKNPVPFFLFPAHPPQDFNEYLRKTVDLAKGRGMRVILLKEPNKLEAGTLDYSLDELARLYEKRKDPALLAQYYTAQLVEIGKDNGLLVIDPFQVINGERKEKLFLDCVHLNPEGNKLLAKVIAEELTHAEE